MVSGGRGGWGLGAPKEDMDSVELTVLSGREVSFEMLAKAIAAHVVTWIADDLLRGLAS